MVRTQLSLEHKEINRNWERGGGNSWGSGVAQRQLNPIIAMNACQALVARISPETTSAATIPLNTQPLHTTATQTNSTIKTKGSHLVEFCGGGGCARCWRTFACREYSPRCSRRESVLRQRAQPQFPIATSSLNATTTQVDAIVKMKGLITKFQAPKERKGLI